MINQYGTSGTFSFRFCLAILVIALTTFVLLMTAGAANKYVKPGGSGDGSSWSSAGAPSLINASGAGDIIYLAGGSYGNGIRIDASGSASSPVTVRRATTADHGTDTGWSAAMDAQAV